MAVVGRRLPRTGEEGWPAPAGPYADRWQALMDMAQAAPDCGRVITRAVTRTLDDLYRYGGRRPHMSYAAEADLMAYRSREGRGDAITLAEVAPTLGIAPAPAPVKGTRWYQGITDLELVEQPV
ncbi:hypothetical protein ABTZ59_36930 [Streptomyces sp. NPDC094034]|uniref:hypothetical protein n=1 Tax=Streptomyces sp. NPDC094034 TaxID=3155309 RepID=UPI003327BEB0